MDNLTAGNPAAHRVRVYYTGSDTLHEGEALCYSFKTTKNWWGGSVSNGEVTASERVVEGYHNPSKYICVESPMRASTTTATWTQATKLLTDDGAEFDNLQVGMFVSVASATDDDIDGNWEITAQSAAANTITLGGMTDAEAALVTDAIADVTVQIDNTSSVAGVVAKGGWCGKAGPRVIDIYVANGAVVPVRNDQNCVLGRTILAVHSNEQFLTAPHADYARPIAIAWETVDTATTTGLCLAKLDPNMFIHQMGDDTSLIVDDEDTTSSVLINKANIKFNGSATYNRVLYMIGELAGGGAGLNGMFKFRAYVSSTMTNCVQVVCANLHLKDDGVLKAVGGGEYDSCFYATIETEETSSPAVLTTLSVCAYQAAYYLDESETTPAHAYVLGVPSGFGAGTYQWDGLLIAQGAGAIGAAASPSGPAFGAGDIMIPCRIGDTTYYLAALVDAGAD